MGVSFKNIMNKQQFYIRYKKLLKVKDTKTAKIGRGQDFEALINDVLEDENVCREGFSFQILFWNDIEEMLKKESNINVYHKYY